MNQITVFDKTIEKYHLKYELPYDWRLIKSQLWQESKLDPTAKSQAGALGIAQFMPLTWEEYVVKLGLVVKGNHPSRFDATTSIECCCAMMRDLIDKWTYPRPKIDQYALALASYNAGFGNILEAQKKSGGSTSYKEIIKSLPHVTGVNNSLQTINYVENILHFYVDSVL